MSIENTNPIVEALKLASKNVTTEGASLHPQEEEEKYQEVDLEVDEPFEDFSQAISKEVHISASTVKQQVMDFFSEIFLDVSSVDLKLTDRNKLVELRFRYIPDKIVDENEKKLRLLQSTAEQLETSSMCEALLAINNASTVKSDASSYADLNKKGKAILSKFMWKNPQTREPKKRFVKNENYQIVANSSYDYTTGRTFNEISCIMYLDINTLFNTLCKTSPKEYSYDISAIALRADARDCLVSFKQTNLKTKRKTQRELGIDYR